MDWNTKNEGKLFACRSCNCVVLHSVVHVLFCYTKLSTPVHLSTAKQERSVDFFFPPFLFTDK